MYLVYAFFGRVCETIAFQVFITINLFLIYFAISEQNINFGELYFSFFCFRRIWGVFGWRMLSNSKNFAPSFPIRNWYTVLFWFLFWNFFSSAWAHTSLSLNANSAHSLSIVAIYAEDHFTSWVSCNAYTRVTFASLTFSYISRTQLVVLYWSRWALHRCIEEEKSERDIEHRI